MCIGIPMKVIEGGAIALCEGRGERRRLNMLMVGEQPPGTWVLAFLDSAREVLSAEDALRLDRALDGLQAALRGETDLDGYFADLVRPQASGG